MRFPSTSPVAAGVFLALVSLGPWANVAEAQYFGRNKVQYENFDFKTLKTEHFDILYYPEAQAAVEQAGRMAERWYARLSRLFNHELSGRQVVILYADHPDFEQTTALLGSIDEATGGVTEAFKRRVVLPMAGSLAETDHVLGHELVHAFQFDITTQSRSAIGGGFPTALAMPLWFIEGMAEYLSLGPVYPHTAMWLHDAVRRDIFPSFRDLANPKYFPYRYGHGLWAYIGGRWGDPVVGEILKAASTTGNVAQAIATVLQISPDELMASWEESIREAYTGLVDKTQSAGDYGRVVISPETGSGNLNVAPAVSPDGSQVVFLSEKDRFSIEMFRADAQTGEVKKKILKTATDPHYESLQFISSAGDWHPDGRQFVFSGVSRGKPIITILDAERGKKIEEFKVEEAGEIFNPSWSPDGGQIVYAATVGGLMDLFVLDVATGEHRRLTEDAYADLQPEWSPDGRRIAFVTDRFTTDLRSLDWGPYEIAFIDPVSLEVERAPGFAGAKNINPQWSSDGSNLYFISDVNGISNIYRASVPDGEIFQVTNLTTGVSGITELSPALSVATETDRLVFSAYEGDRYTIYAVDSAAVLEGGPVLPPLADVSPAVLPPADRPVGDVMALVGNAELGLPPTSDEFERTKYSAGLSLDYIAPPQVAVGSDRYGTFVGGGTALFWSDNLGEHSLATLLQVNGSFKDIAAVVGYENRKSRWNWGGTVGQIPILNRRFGYAFDQTTGEFLEQELRLRQTSREASGLLTYPVSRVQRFEFSGQYRNISYDYELISRTLSPTGSVIEETTESFPKCESDDDLLFEFCVPRALNLGTFTTALVYDNTFFGYTGPVLGQRYRIEIAPTVGSLNYVGALLDYRRYFMPIAPYTLAGRFLHFGRYGSGGEDPRLQALFLGYQQLIRGYDSGSFEFVECVGIENSPCPVYDQLFGSRVAMANIELRTPIPQGLGVSPLPGLPPITIAFFFDAGVAWWSGNRALLLGGNEDPWSPVTSYGIAGRINLFGVALLEIDFVHPNNRPEKGWYWQFGFSPGF
ncbi:MAG: BamA/TamA family outer membrane protein [Gemmatimonadales bacterium]|jgi:Tol biopolymer transport system component